MTWNRTIPEIICFELNPEWNGMSLIKYYAVNSVLFRSGFYLKYYYVCTLCLKKGGHLMFDNNFGKQPCMIMSCTCECVQLCCSYT